MAERKLATQTELDAMFAQAVILAPAASARNVIQPTLGSVIAAVVKAHAAQSVDIFRVEKSDGGGYVRVGATGAVGFGNGTYDPAAYGGLLTGYVFSRAADGYWEANGGPSYTPGAFESVYHVFADVAVQPSADGLGNFVSHIGMVSDLRLLGTKTAHSIWGFYGQARFSGTKAAASGTQVQRIVGGQGLAVIAPGSTGDVADAIGFLGTAGAYGSGTMGLLRAVFADVEVQSSAPVTDGVFGVDTRVINHIGSGTAIPALTAIRARAYATGARAVTVAKGVDVENIGQLGTVVTSYGLYMAAQSGATNVYGIYVAGGKSVFVDTLLTGKIAAPADADIANSQGGWWWDQANSLPKWKGKTSGGSVVNFVPADATGLSDHLADTSDAHDASAISSVAAGGLSATDVQAALNELDTEKANYLVTVNTQTDSYTLALSDASKVVEMNKATANDLTVPPNSSVAFPVGTIIELHQLGAGQTTVVAGGGVTIRSPGGKLKLTGQYSSASLRKRATDEWTLAGDIAA
jgi:hypothetical protein